MNEKLYRGTALEGTSINRTPRLIEFAKEAAAGLLMAVVFPEPALSPGAIQPAGT